LHHDDILTSGVEINEIDSEYVLQGPPIGCEDFQALVASLENGATCQVTN
jgi:hypothetical protein